MRINHDRIATIIVWSLLCVLTGIVISGYLPARSRQPQLVAHKSAMDDILLKDYDPISSLVVPETRLLRARYPVIDMHSHPFAANTVDVSQWVRTMDAVGIDKTIILSGAIYSELDQVMALYLKTYPERFIIFCGVDVNSVRHGGEAALRELDRAYRNGVRGVGEIRDKGQGIDMGLRLLRDDVSEPATDLHFDDVRLDPIWDKCALLHLPVSIHIADHPSAWRPPDRFQERPPAFQIFNRFGRPGLSYSELLSRLDLFLTRHSKTMFIVCHLANEGNDLERLRRLMDSHPNIYIDMSARDYELGRQPRTSASFVNDYHSRVLFGTDLGRDTDMYRAWWRLLETNDEYIRSRVWWRLYGLSLPTTTLSAIYRDAAGKLLRPTQSQQ